MKVVSNAGPLIAFGKLNRLDLLVAMYERLMIPIEVHREIRFGVWMGYGHSLDISALIESGSIRVLAVDPVQVAFERPINLGEVGAIRLALQEKAALVLIDDRDARIEAARLGLRVKGTVGVIIAAIAQNLISASEAIRLLETIRQRSDIWVGAKVVQAAIDEIRKRSSVG